MRIPSRAVRPRPSTPRSTLPTASPTASPSGSPSAPPTASPSAPRASLRPQRRLSPRRWGRPLSPLFLSLAVLGLACQATPAPAGPARTGPGGAGGSAGGGGASGDGREGGAGSVDAAPATSSPRASTRDGSAKQRWRFQPRWTLSRLQGHKGYEDAIVGHVNALRRRRGLAPLQPDERLRVGARQHTREMIDRGYYSHTSPVTAWRQPRQRACYAGYLDPFVSENIGLISGYPDPARAMFESWKKSPGHLRNMVDPKVTRIGVGLSSAERQGVKVWIGTQLFAANDLDLRRIEVRTQRQRVRRLRVTLQTTGGLEIKAWRGRRFAGDVPARGRGHRFVRDLPRSRSGSVRFDFAVKVGSQTPLVCAKVEVGADGRAKADRITYHPTCRRIQRIRAKTETVSVRQRVLSGQVKDLPGPPGAARFYLNNTWGPSLPLKTGRWVRFSQPLPSAQKVSFSLVLGKLHKEYLDLDFSKADPFRCP